MRDVHVDGAVTDRYVTPPRLFQEARTRHDAPGAAHQSQEQIEFDAGQIRDFAVDRHLSRADVQAHAADAQMLLARVELGAAQHRAEPGQELPRAEGLAEVVVRAQLEPDHAIHEELRGVLHEVVAAINSGQYDKMLPYLSENVEATSITQEVMSSRADVSKYFQEWFGPTGYMRKMEMTLDADALTELSPDKSWGFVRGKALEHYEAKDGDLFDFATR